MLCLSIQVEKAHSLRGRLLAILLATVAQLQMPLSQRASDWLPAGVSFSLVNDLIGGFIRQLALAMLTTASGRLRTQLPLSDPPESSLLRQQLCQLRLDQTWQSRLSFLADHSVVVD